MENLSDLELLQEIKRLETEYDQAPSAALMASRGVFDPDEFFNRFGSWESALRKAGIDPDRLETERYQLLQKLKPEKANEIFEHLESNDTEKFFKGQLLAELNRLAVELEKTPSIPETRKYGRHSISSYQQHFGSWNAAVRKLDLTPNQVDQQIPEEKLLAELRQLAEQKGERPSTLDMQRDGKYSYPTYNQRFDSWEQACEKAGL